ncbi:aminobenzoyl-glutamate utilization protein B [Leeuwenhoekiella aestuarii]|uniref:Aminobenzoyl-glutamate utilization protein B n=1 Tax=Leeuwenhoekiella aestuarii TaxID=2249426 RepID=A0A4Q0NY34_9FLAO|nr:amidohydrolase [Leeuwenhoekiella aestuarii]RXG15670.1 aminobenzoyl-glutamate utilization protein B [Leeuwenhoekiella aestuarii]RXG17221.1 aminobenzoyl-glutamate utilization protein B [Leeuwenhoekiella aestuarii]
MNTKITVLIILFCSIGFGQKIPKDKKQLIASVENHKEDLISISDKIWANAEIAFQETESSKLLADYAEANGFTVERVVADIPTAFIATYGEGKPVISVLGEFDALPGISQKAQPTKEPLEAGAAGHGCGHNLFGTASLGAAIAIKEMIEAGEIKGTIKFIGTPAEEKFFGKLWMLEAGVWDDVDVNVSWHPSADTKADVQSSLAMVDFIVEFYGQAAHAAADPWNGRSASDALELYTTGINYYREHIKPTVRIHYHIQDGGQVVNVVPDYSKLWVRVRNTDTKGMLPVFEQVKKMAEGAAIMANVDYKYSLVSGIRETLVNRTGGAVMQKNLELLGPLEYTEEEIAFGKKIQEMTDKPQVGMDSKIYPFEETRENPGGGSTDVGDVSWNVPNINLGVTVAPKDTPWHSWAVVACGGMSIGHKGMIMASKAMSMTMFDLFDDAKLVEEVKTEFKERKGDDVYKAMIPDGPPPIGN